MTPGARRAATAVAMLLAAALLAVGAVPVPSAAQDSTVLRTPWATGEFLEYSLKFGVISAGSGRMQVTGRDTLRGRPVWRLKFDFSGGVGFLRVQDVFESWVDVETHNSLQFVQRISEPGYKRLRTYRIYPERSVFRLDEQEERTSVPNPLDDAAFFFFIRTIPLEVGQSYDFQRYFDPKANPVTIRVLRRESVEVPAGKFNAIVIQPMIKTSGIFSEGGHAELWLSDDDRRILLQMKSKLKFGSLNLYLRKFTLPAIAPDSARTPERSSSR